MTKKGCNTKRPEDNLGKGADKPEQKGATVGFQNPRGSRQKTTGEAKENSVLERLQKTTEVNRCEPKQKFLLWSFVLDSRQNKVFFLFVF